MKKLVSFLFIVLLFSSCGVEAQNITVSYSPSGNVLVKKNGTTIVNVLPNLETVCDTQQVVGYSYAIVRFKAGNSVLDTMHYSATRDSMTGLTAWQFTNYMNLKYMVTRPAGQYWRIPSATRTALPGTSFIPQIIQVEDTDSGKVMTRNPAGVWKSAILN